MKIFVCEFITGGGYSGSPLPEQLAREGDLMLHAVIRDLIDAGYGQIVTTRDSRLEQLPAGIETRFIDQPVWDCWENILHAADAALLIAPETDSVLYRLTVLAEDCGCRLLGCDSSSIAITTSKRTCAEWIAKQGIAVPLHYPPDRLPSEADHTLVLKPDDGVGAEDCYRFEHVSELESRLNDIPDRNNWLIQDWVAGQAASMTLLCFADRAIILAVNRQLVEFRDNRCEFTGVIVNDLAHRQSELTLIADQIGRSIPGLYGFIGVDFIWSGQGPVVLEINPRLTTAYAGLRESLGYNPVELLLSNPGSGDIPDMTATKQTPVTVRVDND